MTATPYNTIMTPPDVTLSTGLCDDDVLADDKIEFTMGNIFEIVTYTVTQLELAQSGRNKAR
jgi:hypothetical protein